MFREPQCSFESVATVLSILKIQQEYNGKCPRAVIDQDYDFEVYWEALFSAAEVVTFHEEIYQQTEESLFTFQDSAMTEYFQLCNEYGKRKHIRWKKNPYVFPLPRILFQFQIENSGRISSVWLKIVPKGRLDNETACFLWPFSNVRRNSSLCLGCNELPHVDDLQRLKHLPRFILELPCNDDLFDSSKNQMGFSLSDLLEHLKDKESSYYYDKILIPQPGEKLAHFLKKE